MHFLGAVIAEKQDDIYGILAEWSEYADVDEYVKETRSEIIANGRADDQAYLEDHGNDTDPMHEKFKKAAAGRLALDDEAALKRTPNIAGSTSTRTETPCPRSTRTVSTTITKSENGRESTPCRESHAVNWPTGTTARTLWQEPP